jgi:hypothetical protein
MPLIGFPRRTRGLEMLVEAFHGGDYDEFVYESY